MKEQIDFNQMIGELDHSLSGIMAASKTEEDPINRRTLKHHAEDLILCGVAILKATGKSDKDIEKFMEAIGITGGA